MKIHSIGHSNRNFDEFFSILFDFKIEHLVDVRRYPTSSRYTHFNRKHIEAAFEANHQKIKYSFLGEELGGKREFGYSDFMKSYLFADGLKKLVKIASHKNSCFMCAEKNYQNCHRQFIAERLIQSGWEVIHIIGRNQTVNHQLSLL